VRAPLQRLAALLAWSVVGLIGASPSPALPTHTCDASAATGTIVGRPTTRVAWRAELLGQTSVYATVPYGRRTQRRGSLAPSQVAWLLVLRAADDRKGHRWVKVRLPARPNRAAGWIDSERVLLRPTDWRIVISLATRTLTVDRAGAPTRRLRVVIGAPTTPTPTDSSRSSAPGAHPQTHSSARGYWRSPHTVTCCANSTAATGASASTAAAPAACATPSAQPAATVVFASQTPQSTGSCARSAPPNCPAHPSGLTKERQRTR
jgi:hypothetical protein